MVSVMVSVTRISVLDFVDVSGPVPPEVELPYGAVAVVLKTGIALVEALVPVDITGINVEREELSVE